MKCPACRASNGDDALACGRCGAALVEPTQAHTGTPSLVVAVNLTAGTLFAGRYEIVRPLGQGGMGMVYLARDRRLDEPLAIKVLRPDFARDPAMADRFRSEIKLARRVRHRNVAAIHDYGEDGGLLFISMEFIDGVDLKQLLRQRGAFPPGEAYEMAIQIVEGLHAVHEAGVIHRDLKTPNIMVDAKGVARLMDFGIAKQHVDGGGTTGTGHILGTPEYMSPEQAQGKKVDFRSDIYAMGVVIHELFTGKVPFRGDTPIATILKHIQEPPPLDGPAAAVLPPALVPVLRKCLAKEPAERYANTQELTEALRRARHPLSKQELLPTGVLQAPTLKQPKPAAPVKWIAIAAGVAVLAGAVWMLTAVRTRTGSTGSTSVTPEEPARATAPPATASPTIEAVAAASPAPQATPRPTSSRRDTSRTATLTPASIAAATAAPVPATPSPSPSAAPAAVETDGEPGWLLVAAHPWAIVHVDGANKGTTPLDRFSLPAGRHKVLLERPGYESHEVTVVIRPGQIERVRFNFETQGKKQ